MDSDMEMNDLFLSVLLFHCFSKIKKSLDDYSRIFQ
jgi:hypothetical protein